jgi:hypothetical protein
MELSYHKNIRGKPVKQYDAKAERDYYMCKDRRVSLGWGWENLEGDWPTIFELITVDGIATSAKLTCENRKEAHFVSRDLIMVDIDSGMTIPELFADTFYEKYAAGFYCTASHTWEAHRFRIMFRLETPLTVATDVVKLNKMLLRKYTQGDAACKDATRIFYGVERSVACERRDNVLPDSAVCQLIDQYNAWEAAEMASYSQVEHQPLDDWQRQRILTLLHATYVGEYAKWRDIGWGLKAGGFSLADYQYVTTGMMSQKTPVMAQAIWADGKPNGKITMGTVIWFLKSRHGQDCLKREIAQDQHLMENGDILLTNKAVLAQERRELAAIRRMIRND